MRFSRHLPVVLALLLSGNQLAAAQHGIDHLVAPGDHACTQCLHQPGQKHALPGWVVADAPGGIASTSFFTALPSRDGASRNPYQSRAPPVSLR
ncbi:MAG TPA: hypothetical protein VIC61_02340 [Gammaproteobacteria bacterium]|jgi:hypothetical protein